MEKTELIKKEMIAFETGEDQHTMFYYSRPYKRDYDLCNWNPLRLFSGNVLKYYQYKVDKPVVLVTDTDDKEEYERLIRLELERRGTPPDDTSENEEDDKSIENMDVESQEEEFVDMSKITSEISQEELSQILNDNSEESEEEI